MKKDDCSSAAEDTLLSADQNGPDASRAIPRRSFLQAGSAVSLSMLYAQPRPASVAARPWWEREGPLRIIDTGSCYTGVTSPSPGLDASQKASLEQFMRYCR